jgi:hypothetical protein
MKDIYRLKLHDTARQCESDSPLEYFIIRVAGGWIYNTGKTSTFVPWDNEFQEATK